jgi:hypothetical protein
MAAIPASSVGGKEGNGYEGDVERGLPPGCLSGIDLEL